MLTTLTYGQTMEKRDFLADIGHERGVLETASVAAGSTRHVVDDLAAALFPKSAIGFSDRMLSYSRQYLLSLVSEIETEICLIALEKLGIQNDSIAEIGNSSRCYVIPLLERSGLLASRAILEHVFYQAQKAELTTRLMHNLSQEQLETSLTRYLDNPDAKVADAAMALLVAQGKEGSDVNPMEMRVSSLPADVLHALVWPVAAAIKKLSGYSGSLISDAAQNMLTEFDEGQSVQNRAQKLARLIETKAEPNLGIPHPIADGITIFIARLVQISGLTAKQIVKFTAEPDMARLVVVLKALDFASQDAISIHSSMDTSGRALSVASYNEIDGDIARQLLSDWTQSEFLQEAESRLDTNDMGFASS